MSKDTLAILLSIVVAVVGFALYLIDKSGKNTPWITVCVLFIMSALCLWAAFLFPWIWNPASIAQKIWRGSLVAVIVLLSTARFGIWVWPTSGEAQKNVADSSNHRVERVAPPSAVPMALSAAETPPNVLFLYENHQFKIYNRGADNIYLWGSTYGDLAVTTEKEPRLIIPGAYYYLFGDEFEDKVQKELKTKNEILVSCHFFIKTERSQEYTVKGAVLVKKLPSDELSFNPQTIGIFGGWSTKEPTKRSTSSPHQESEPPISSPGMTPTDVKLRFIYPNKPALVVSNLSNSVARTIKWTVLLWNMDLPDRNDPLPIPVGEFDFIRAHTEGGPQNLFDSPLVAPLLKPGNRLFGSASVDCPDCDRGRTYIVYIVFGKGGWFSEVVNEKSGGSYTPNRFDKAGREEYFRKLDAGVPEEHRTPIPEK